MKKILVLISLLVLSSCASNDVLEERENLTYLDKSFTVKAADPEAFQFLLMESFPIEGGPVISKEPEHAEISAIVRTDNGIVYTYKPKDGFIGQDRVEITNMISAGGPEMYPESVTRIKITIQE